MIKKAGLEESSLTDPQTGLKIRVSTTARIKYRKYIEETISGEESFSNIALNDLIAKDFYVSSNNVLHYFIANSSSVSSTVPMCVFQFGSEISIIINNRWAYINSARVDLKASMSKCGSC